MADDEEYVVTGDNEQAVAWSGTGGLGWVRMAAVVDRVFAPLEALLVDRVRGPGEAVGLPPRSVLDVGCGTGAVTVAVAASLGAGSTCQGVDVSQPMVDAARERAERARSDAQFLVADAERHPFEGAAFDVLLSRFGIMFFHDPVAAFVNLRTAVRAGGQLIALVWRGPEENPFMTEAERAAAPVLGLVPRTGIGPGQFSFADAAHVVDVLSRAGWKHPGLEPVDVECEFPEPDLVPYLMNLGPVARALAGADAATRARVTHAVRPAFEPYITDDLVRFRAACWWVTARV